MLGSWVIAAGATVLAMTGCGKHPAASSAERAGNAAAAPLVAEAERSAHFAAVAAQLELGGTLFGYVDIDGDVAKLAEGLQNLAEQATQAQPMAAAFLPKDFAAVFQDLGFADVKALGLSSVAEAGGTFRNRAFFYTPEGRRGLLAGLGGEPREFTVARLAPADADVVFESEVDAPAVYSAIRAVIVRVAGEPMAAFVDAKLKQPDPNSPISPMDAIEAFKGRISLALRVDETRSFSPQPGAKRAAFRPSLG